MAVPSDFTLYKVCDPALQLSIHLSSPFVLPDLRSLCLQSSDKYVSTSRFFKELGIEDCKMASRIPTYENDAPEAVERSSDLIPAPNQMQHDSEYPQVVQQYPAAKIYPPYDAAHHTPGSSQSGYDYKQEKSGPLLGGEGLEVATNKPSQSRRRKRIIWILAGAALLILAVGLGAGLGVGLSSSSKSSNTRSDGESQSTTSQ